MKYFKTCIYYVLFYVLTLSNIQHDLYFEGRGNGGSRGNSGWGKRRGVGHRRYDDHNRRRHRVDYGNFGWGKGYGPNKHGYGGYGGYGKPVYDQSLWGKSYTLWESGRPGWNNGYDYDDDYYYGGWRNNGWQNDGWWNDHDDYGYHGYDGWWNDNDYYGPWWN